MTRIFVQTRRDAHLSSITVGGKLEDVAGICKERNYSKVAVVSSANTRGFAGRILSALASKGVPAVPITIEDGEKNKTVANAVSLLAKLHGAGLDRHSAVVAVGGGVLGDVSGFAASTYLRGISVVQVPTTLMAMVDSSVGGKTGVNLDAKNVVGTFHSPDAVMIDFSVLSTLPDDEFRQGLAEIAKAGCIADPALFSMLEKERERMLARDEDALSRAVEAALKVKAAIVEKDPTESHSHEGEVTRMALNLGHTFAHGIEHASGYSLRHGDAVSLGIVAACSVSEKELGLDPGESARIARLLSSFGLPIRAGGIGAQKVLEKMRQDKKNRAGEINLVLLESIGKTKVVRAVSERVLLDALRKVAQ
ncbi:MAG: 3-dehydroquinate synthase [Candidatus Omnitrophica bacterium]|nr:3-dehydroquinate synthase [Candidatus Omnitrophota bacterium]